MSTSSTHLPKPKGLLRLVYNLPSYLYHLRLGWLLGHRFLMLTHKGRKTGRIRHTVLEVIRYDMVTEESIVVSAYGENSDWYRNIQANPALEIQTGRKRYVPIQRFLTPDEVYMMFTDYERRHPQVAHTLLKLVGYQYDGSESERRALAASLRMVAFLPKDQTVVL
ncbi:MAG: nitroreductase family deazaflavin-dependent oxidoreductase [archaeon]|nr:nitroreductase family deazaflavin-dependent oxidoreductase [archaeon]MCP8305821.1 nitroreductase family deazaflavin-dependent oxidoreductase [archaeon]